MNDKRICRLCLNIIITLRHDLSETLGIREMLVTIFPQMNINLTETIDVCQDCLNSLHFAVRVRESYLTKIQAGLEKTLDSFPHCQICFESESDFKPLLHKMNHSEMVLRHCLKVALPEHRHHDITICAICWSWMKSICSFKSRYFKIEEYLNWYSLRQNNKTLSNDDIENILREKYQRFIATNFEYDSHRVKQITVDPTKNKDCVKDKTYILCSGDQSTKVDIPTKLPISFYKEYFKEKGEVFSNQGIEKAEVVSNFVRFFPNNNKSLSCYDIDDEFDEFKEKENNDYGVITIEDDSFSEPTNVTPVTGKDSTVKTNKINDNLNHIRSDHLISSTERELPKNDGDDDDGFQNRVIIYCESTQFIELARNMRNNQDSSERANNNKRSTCSPSQLNSTVITHKIPDKESLAPILSKNKSTSMNDVSIEETSLTYNSISSNNDIYENRLIINEPNEVEYEEECFSIEEESCYEMVSEENDVIDLTNAEDDFDDLPNTESERNVLNLTEMELHKSICWACYKCKAMFFKKSSIKQHLLNHDNPWNKYGRFKCHLCPFVSNWKASVTRHQVFHTKDSDRHFSNMRLTYLCPYCYIIYLNKENVEAHVSEHVISWNKFQCLECMFSTNLGGTLRRHYRVHHCQKTDPNFLPRQRKEALFSDSHNFC